MPICAVCNTIFRAVWGWPTVVGLERPRGRVLSSFRRGMAGGVRGCNSRPSFPGLRGCKLAHVRLSSCLFSGRTVLSVNNSGHARLAINNFVAIVPMLVLSYFPSGSPVCRGNGTVAAVVTVVVNLLLTYFYGTLLRVIVLCHIGGRGRAGVRAFVGTMLFCRGEWWLWDVRSVGLPSFVTCGSGFARDTFIRGVSRITGHTNTGVICTTLVLCCALRDSGITLGSGTVVVNTLNCLVDPLSIVPSTVPVTKLDSSLTILVFILRGM